MTAKTYSYSEFKELQQNYSRLPDENGFKVYLEGLDIKEKLQDDDYRGIHYWQGLPCTMFCKESDFLFIAIINPDSQVKKLRTGSFSDKNGNEVAKKYYSVKTPVQGMIQLQINPYNRKELWLNFVEVHTEFRGKKLLNDLLVELVAEMKRNGLKLVRSRVSATAPVWLKPKIDKLLDENSIEWTQEA